FDLARRDERVLRAMQRVHRAAHALGRAGEVHRALQISRCRRALAEAGDVRKAERARRLHRLVVGEIEQHAPGDADAKTWLVSGAMDGVVAAEAAADHPKPADIELRSLRQPVDHGARKAMETGLQLGLEVHLSLPRTIEGARGEAAREAAILEQQALLFGAL